MPDKPHRSRIGWRDMKGEPDDADLVPGMPYHYHRPPRWIARCIVGLFALGALNLAGLTMSLVYDMQQQDYIMGRGEQRDSEREQAEQNSQRRFCEFLSLWPADDALADLYRYEYGCSQPGRAIDEFPPEVQAELGSSAGSEPQALPLLPPVPEPDAFDVPPPRRPTPESPGSVDAAPAAPLEPAPAEPTPPATPPASPTPPPPPLIDLAPLTDPLCDGLRICL